MEGTLSDHPGMFAAGQPRLLRAINERTILELIRRTGTTSRAQIARESGLSKPTVSLALAGLIEAGLVHEVGRATGGKGPSAVLYELNPSAGWVVGIDVGRHWVRAAAADITGTIVARRDERARARSSAHADRADRRRSLTRWPATPASAGARSPTRPWARPASSTRGAGAVALAPNLPGFGRQGLVGAIRDELGTAISFENDVNMAALGELSDGAGRDVGDVRVPVGRHRRRHGHRDRRRGSTAARRAPRARSATCRWAPATRTTAPCAAAACWRRPPGAAAVSRIARQRNVRPPTPDARVRRRRGGATPRRSSVVDEEARRIALAIAAVLPVLDPELVILGGGIGGNGDLLLAPVERELRRAVAVPAPHRRRRAGRRGRAARRRGDRAAGCPGAAVHKSSQP